MAKNADMVIFMKNFLKKIAYYDGSDFLKKSLGFSGLSNLLDEFKPEESGFGMDSESKLEQVDLGKDSTDAQLTEPFVSSEELTKAEGKGISASDAEKLITKKLSDGKIFLSRAASSIATIQSKKSDGPNSLWSYLLSPKGEKEFEIMKSLINCNGELGSIKLTPSLKRYERWISNMRSHLTRSFEKMLSIMGNAITILSIKESASSGEEKSKFASLKSELIRKIEDSKKFSGTPIEVVESSTALPGSYLGQKQNLFEAFKRDILLNISNIGRVREIVQARIDQIESQGLSEGVKEHLFTSMKAFVFQIIGKITKFNQDLEEAFENPGGIDIAKKSILADIASSNLPPDAKAKAAEQISIIFKRKMDELRKTRGFAAQTLQKDLQRQFPDITEGLYSK